MALDRIIALVFVAFCCVYGYSAFFVMDETLAPFMRRNPIWPSTFPKILSVLGIIVGLVVLLGIEKSAGEKKTPEIDYRRLGDYKIGQAAGLLAAMALYALVLRPIGFLPATTLFLFGSAVLLGERRFLILIPVCLVAAGGVWALVQEVLGIFLSPWPSFLM